MRQIVLAVFLCCAVLAEDAPESGLIRSEKMTNAEVVELRKAEQSLQAVRDKIAGAHDMHTTIGQGWQGASFAMGMACSTEYKIENSFLLYYQQCTPMAMLTSN